LQPFKKGDDSIAIYFPVLRWKLGERSALHNLSLDVKEQIAPIVEFPLDCDFNDRKYTDFCDTAIQDWGINRPFYLDLNSVDFDNAPKGNNHPVLTLIRTAHEKQLIIIPVLNVGMEQDVFRAIQQAYKHRYFENIAIRITEDEEDTAPADVQRMLDDIGIRHRQVDLIIDLCDVSNVSIRAKIRGLHSLVNQFGKNYRRSIVISGAIPNQLDNYVVTDDEGHIPRHDWALWIQARRSDNLTHLLFGDYTTITCRFQEVPYQGAPKIKYTLNDQWFIIKGHRSRQRDNQRQEQSLVIASSPFFRGTQNSFGDMRIRQCSDGIWGPGNPTNWVTIDINQHITFVTFQVSAILAVP